MGGREKGLLREAAGALLPESLRYRRKSPYPKTCDPAYARIVCGMVQGMLAEKKAPFCSWWTRGRWKSWPPRTSLPRRRRGSGS